MRRKEKEIVGKAKVIKKFNEAQVCRIAFNDSPFPYIIPVHFVYIKDCFYFHSAEEGRKIELIKKDGQICFETDKVYKILSNEKACNWSTKYESIIGTGRAVVVEDLEEKRKALSHLMNKYSEKIDWEIPKEVIKCLSVIRVNILSITGKSSGM